MSGRSRLPLFLAALAGINPILCIPGRHYAYIHLSRVGVVSGNYIFRPVFDPEARRQLEVAEAIRSVTSPAVVRTLTS
jgi:hypothetical protein